MTHRRYLAGWLVSLLLAAGMGPALAATATPAARPFASASLAGLVDTAGRTQPADPYPGKYRLVLFGFTSCADVCPLTLMALKEGMRLLGKDAARVVPVFISVDAERDTPAILGQYVRAFDPRIQGLGGSQAVLERVARDHGIFFEKRWVEVKNNVYVFDHTASILLIGPDGKLVTTVSSVGTPVEVAQRIAAAFPKEKR
jgi:protein SCO1/2